VDVVWNGSTVGESNDFSPALGLPNTCTSSVEAVGDVAYRWTAPQRGRFRFTADTTHTALFSIRDASCPEVQLSCTTGSGVRTLDLDLEEGQTILFVMDGYTSSSSEGTFTLSATCLDFDGSGVCGDESSIALGNARYNRWSVAGMDMDGDGMSDIAAGTERRRRLVIWTGNGDGDDDGFPLSTDCNDDNPAVNPSVPEDCNTPIDDNCDGDLGGGTYYVDSDGDGYGNPNTASSGCVPSGNGFSAITGDCDDTRADVHEGAPEVCDGVDQDCDGQIDEDATGLSTFYPDDDGDGFGAGTSPILACSAPPGAVISGSDCDDTSQTRFPVCAVQATAVDDICDGQSD